MKGEGEVAGEISGRSITVEHILHNGFSRHQDLTDALSAIDDLLLKNATLVHTTGTGATFQDERFKLTTFESYELRALPGQEQPGPLKDVTGTLFKDNGEADGGWFLPLTLRFRQLLVSKT